MSQYAQLSDTSHARTTRKSRRPRRRLVLVALALLAALAVAGCSSKESTSGSSSGTPTAAATTASKLSVADKNTFSTAMVAYVELQPKVTDQIAAAQGSGDWATAESSINATIAQMKEQINVMQTQAAKMPASAQGVANGIVANANAWNNAAMAAVAAGKSGNAESLQASLATISSLSTEMKTKATDWDAVAAG